MKTTTRPTRPGGTKDFKKGTPKPWEKKKTFGRRDDDSPREFGKVSHDAICGECSSPCDVPFKPTGSRPVLCNKCFKKDGAPSDQKRSRAGASFGTDRPKFGDKRPAFGEKRPYSRPEGAGFSRGMKSDEFKILDAKLDAILRALS